MLVVIQFQKNSCALAGWLISIGWSIGLYTKKKKKVVGPIPGQGTY